MRFEVEHLVELVERVHFDLDRQVGCRHTHSAQRCAHRSRGGDVIVFDQRSVTEPHAMVDAATRAHRILLQITHARQRLSRVTNLRSRSVDGVDPLCCRGGYPREMTRQVECRALRGEQSGGRRVNRQHHVARCDSRAVGNRGGHLVRPDTDDLVENSKYDGQPGDHSERTADDLRVDRRACGHRRRGGDVGSVAQILVQCRSDQRPDLVGDGEVEFSGCLALADERAHRLIHPNPDCRSRSSARRSCVRARQRRQRRTPRPCPHAAHAAARPE